MARPRLNKTTCNICDKTLIAGDNWIANSDYRCRPCKKTLNANNYNKNKEYFRNAYKQWTIENPNYKKEYYQNGKEEINAYMKQYKSENKEQSKIQLKNIQCSIKPGVYGVYDGDELVYIGESKVPYARKVNHFSRQGIQGGKSNITPISTAIKEGELDRVNLTFKMLEFINDPQLRLDVEKRLIQRHTPRYNTDNMYSHIH